MKIVTYGNCQARGLSRLLRTCLPDKAYSIEYIANNPRTGRMKSVDEIVSIIGQCDVLIYQPLKKIHGKLSGEYLRQNVVRKDAALVSFPYIFNSGMYSLGRAPQASEREYGRIFGEEVIMRLLEYHTLGRVLEQYRDGQIHFDLQSRFSACIEELRRREQTTDIRLTNFILENYRRIKLFLSHNHPATALFLEILSQVRNITGLPISLNHIKGEEENVAGLPVTNQPFSPYDKAVHGYQFDYCEDWFEKGGYLIELIARHCPGRQRRFNRLAARRRLLSRRWSRRGVRLFPVSISGD